MLVVGMVCCGSLTVYGAEEGLTEEEVKQQVLEIIEAEAEEDKYSIVLYDIEKLYKLIPLNLFVCNYIDGISLEESIEKQKMDLEKLGVNEWNWILPFENNDGKKCYAVFLEQDRKIDIITKSVDVNVNFDMKLFEGKYENVSLEQIREIVYLSLDLYGIRITYVCMKDGVEYIIPYLNGSIKDWCGLENEKVYDIDEFITIMYNCYKETAYDIEENGMANSTLLVKPRKRKFNYENIKQIRIVEKIKSKKNMIVLVIICIFGGCLHQRKSKKKRSEKVCDI